MSIAGIRNWTVHGNGIQIGLFNTCTEGKVVQIGLINKIGKRVIPFLNFGFDKKNYAPQILTAIAANSSHSTAVIL